MQNEMTLAVSDLESAKERNDTSYLDEQFSRARKTLTAGGSVRLNQVFSDAHTETLHVIDSPEALTELEEKYLS